MHSRKNVRSVASSILSFVIAIPLVGGTFAIPQVRAAAPTQELLINEVNWAGSAGNSSDQWIEFYNPGTTDIDFVQHPFSLVAGNTQLAQLTSGVAVHGQYYLVSRLDPSVMASSLDATHGLRPEMVDPQLVIPRTDLQLTLKNKDGEVVDTAGNGMAPLAGSDGLGVDKAVASMSRISGLSDGALSSSWFTPHSVSSGLRGSAGQYGTPAAKNTEIAAPRNLSVSTAPNNGATTVQGTVAAQPSEMLPNSVKVYFTDVATKTVIQTDAQIDQKTGAFTVTTGLPVGSYVVTAVGISNGATTTLSATGTAMIAGSSDNVYTIAPAVPNADVPVLAEYPAATKETSVVISGTVTSGASVTVFRNGAPYSVLPISAGSTTFSVTVALQPNQKNDIEVRATSATGAVSAPVIATVMQDSLSPVAPIAAKVTVSSNAAGTPDSIMGESGAVESGATVEIYSDEALLHRIALVKADLNGGFAQTAIGDNAYGTVYVVVRDAAGNAGPALKVENPIPFVQQPITILVSVSDIAKDQATVKWQAVSGATAYRIKYKMAGGDFSSPMQVCSPRECALSARLTGLAAGTVYSVGIAAVNARGEESNYSESVFTTLAAPVATTVSAAPVAPPYTGMGGEGTDGSSYVPSHGGSYTPSTGGSRTPAKVAPTPTPTITPSPTTTPAEEGQVKSESTSSRNWTPWIILAILVALAAIATAGYFYWFGGDDNDGTGSGTGMPTLPGETVSAVKGSDEVTTKVTKKESGGSKRW